MKFFKRSRMRFGLRGFLCVVPVVGIGFGWFVRVADEHRAEQRYIAAIDSSKPAQNLVTTLSVAAPNQQPISAPIFFDSN